MCGRFASQLPPDANLALFRTAGAVPDLPPSWNVAPSQDAFLERPLVVDWPYLWLDATYLKCG